VFRVSTSNNSESLCELIESLLVLKSESLIAIFIFFFNDIANDLFEIFSVHNVLFLIFRSELADKIYIKDSSILSNSLSSGDVITGDKSNF